MFDEMVNRVILLDNHKFYQVIWVKEIEGRTYLYLLNKDDFSDPLFCERISEEELAEIKDKELLKKVIFSITRDINIFVM